MLHAAVANPDLACGFLFSGQSSGVALELFLEAQPRVCFLPNPPHPPTSVILEIMILLQISSCVN